MFDEITKKFYNQDKWTSKTQILNVTTLIGSQQTIKVVKQVLNLFYWELIKKNKKDDEKIIIDMTIAC